MYPETNSATEDGILHTMLVLKLSKKYQIYFSVFLLF